MSATPRQGRFADLPADEPYPGVHRGRVSATVGIGLTPGHRRALRVEANRALSCAPPPVRFERGANVVVLPETIVPGAEPS